MTSETCAKCGKPPFKRLQESFCCCEKFILKDDGITNYDKDNIKYQNHSPQPSVSGTKKRETKSINEHLGFSENTEPKKNPHEVENPSGSDDASSLSDKIVNGLKFQEYDSYTWEHQNWIHKNDVKESIQKLKDEIHTDKFMEVIDINSKIDKIFGSALI